jgi:hypothetical protein
LGGSIWFKHVTRPQGKTVEPIPYQGMSVYPHTQNSVIDQEYIKEWNTRYYPPLIGQTNTITESTTNVNVQGIENVGGLIGYNNGTVSFSAALGNVIGVPSADNNILANENIGGLIGKHVGDFNISNVSAGGTVTAVSHRRVGGLIGYSEYGNISNSQVNSLGINGGDEVGGLVGKTFNSSINNASVNSNYIIGVYYDIGGLVGYADNFNSPFVIISNSTVNIASLATISSSDPNAGTVGGFVGKGIYGTYNNNQVLLTGIISGNTQVGGFFGYVESTTINNANITASVGNQVTSIINNINYSYRSLIGGFAGFSRNNIVNNFTVNNTLNIRGIDYIGGFAGNAQSNTLTSSTLNTINVNIIGVDYVGGLFGSLYNTNQMTISNYIVNGEIIGVEYLGGLFGSLTIGASLDIIDNTANVNIINVLDSTDNNFIGGLAGRIDLISNSILILLIENSSSNGNVIGDYAVGSFIGYFDNSASFSENRTYTKSNSSSGNGTVNGSPASESNQVGVLPPV